MVYIKVFQRFIRVRSSQLQWIVLHFLLTLILPITTIVFLIYFISRQNLLLGMRYVLNHHEMQIFVLESNKYE